MKKSAVVLFVIIFCSVSFAQIPNWFSTHNNSKYPTSEYIIGVGSGGNGITGAETAKKTALADIAAQLRVQVQSEMKSVTENFAVNDDEQIYSDFKRQSRTMVNDEITGADVIETVVDEQSATTYALVVLNRDKYSSGLRSELESGWKQASDLRSASSEYFKKGKINEAIQSSNQIKQVIAPLLAKQVLHNAAAQKPFTFSAAFNPAALQSDIRTYLSQIQLAKKSGDGQKGMVGEKFSQPFVVSVTANGVPCTGVSVSFLLDGTITLGDEMTDEKGLASFSTIVRNGSGIKAKLSLAGVGREFEPNINSSAVNFTWSAKASDKAFSVSVNSKNSTISDAIQSKISSGITQIGYKIVTMSNNVIVVDVSAGVPNKIEGMSGTLFNLTLEATVNYKENKSNTVIGSVTFSSKGVGKSEEEAMVKAAGGLKIDQKELSELLQK